MSESTSVNVTSNSKQLDTASYLDEVPNTFIRNVPYKLRLPLAVLLGYAELLNAGELGPLLPEQQEALLLIINHAHEMRDIVSRISTLLAIQAQQYVRQPLSLALLVAQMVETQRAKAIEAGIHLEIDLLPDLPSVIGDNEQLQLAIECLLENAFKFTPYGGKVSVRVWADKEWTNISVSDTGIGIAKEELRYLFQTFQQLDGSTYRIYGGLGLGLTLVGHIVNAHHGRVEVQSSPGQGSCFTIKLPIPTPPEDTESISPAAASKRRILIVDDEEFVALTLREGLEKLPNCEVAVSMSGQQALQLFEQQPFDLLITDYKMPDLDGVTLASYIRQHYPTTGIIMITAYSYDLIQEPEAAVAIQKVLNKPVRIAEIRDVALETLSLIQAAQGEMSATQTH